MDLRRVDCRKCGKVRREGLEWLLDSPFCSKRFGYVIGAKCRVQTIQDVAKEHMLDWHTVKELDKRYMEEQLKKAGKPSPRVIGIDEISIKKRHQYRVIVSDLERGRAIWFGGQDRSEESLDEFFDFLGEKRSKKIELAVMDMWKPFRVRKQEYARLTGRDRKFIKGQKFALLSHRENLKPDARKGLKTLLAANKRLNTAYLLKESFGQLWDYHREGWARRFFENWRAQLKWQRLKPYEKFARMIDRHWDGIAAYCESENKVALGFVEGLNNKVRVIQRRAYGLRDEEYLRLKVLTCMLPDL